MGLKNHIYILVNEIYIYELENSLNITLTLPRRVPIQKTTQ